MKYFNIHTKFNFVRGGVLLILFSCFFFVKNLNAQIGSGCSTAGKTTWGTSSSSVTNLSTVLPTGFLINTSVVVYGTLNVDLTGFELHGSQLLMQPGSVINIVGPNATNMELDNSEIIGCGVKWQGIRVLPNLGTGIDINTSSIISDADIAISKDISNNNIPCNIFVNHSLFSNNTRCIQMGGAVQFFSTSSIFDGGVVAVDLFDLDHGVVSVTGNSIFRNQESISVAIGNSSPTDLSPKIATVSIRYSTFENTPVGVTINNIFFNNRIMWNTFNNTVNAILGLRTGYYIFRNIITSTDVAVDIEQPDYFSTTIDHNDIQVANNSGFGSFGILMANNFTNLPLNITNNTISNYSIFGIRSVNGVQLNNNNTLIENNTLSSNNNSIGIEIRNTISTRVMNNNVFLGFPNSGLSSDGILVQNGSGNVLFHNSTDALPGVPGFGIRLVNSAQSLVKCNVTNNSRIGFNSSMTCANSNLLYNYFGNGIGILHFNGLQIDDFSQIGLQTYKRNKWNSSYANLGAVNLNSVAPTILQSQFKVETPIVGTPYHPTNSGSGFFDCPTPINILEEANCTTPVTGNDEFTHTSENLERMINNNSSGSSELDVMNWEGRRYSYGFLSRNPNYINEQQQFSTFYNQNSTGFLGQFQQVQNNWQNANNTKPYSTSSMDALRTEIEAGFDQSTPPSNLNALVQEYYNKTVANQNYTNSLANQQLSLLNNISTTQSYEQNLVNVYKVYFATLAKGINHLNADQENLITTVANQCPLTGGSGTLDARAIYNICKSKTHVFDNNCTTATPRSTDRAEIGKLTVSPNPANDVVEVKFKLSKSEKGRLQIINSFGQILVDLEVGDTNQKIISVSQYSSGIYYVRLIEDNTITQIHKVCIVK